MIDRYTRPEMGNIFSLENKYAIWQEIEVLACEAHAEIGESGITREEAAWIREHAAFNKDEVDAIEAVTNHDVIAFLTNMGSYIDKDVPEGSPSQRDRQMRSKLALNAHLVTRGSSSAARISFGRFSPQVRSTDCTGAPSALYAKSRISKSGASQ